MMGRRGGDHGANITAPMARVSRLALPGLLLACASSLAAAAVHFEPVRSENDSPADVILSLYQDHSRLVWIGSREGLTLYDGYSFTRFANNPSDPTSISDNAVRSIFEDSRGALWLGTNTGGLNRLDRRTWRFQHFRHDSADPLSFSHDSVYAIVEAPDGALWIGTQQGLNRLDPGTGKVERFMAGAGDAALSNDYITARHMDGDGGLWVGTVGGGLSKLDPRTGRFTTWRHDAADPQSLGDDRVYTMLPAGGGLLLGTDNGLSLMDCA